MFILPRAIYKFTSLPAQKSTSVMQSVLAMMISDVLSKKSANFCHRRSRSLHRVQLKLYCLDVRLSRKFASKLHLDYTMCLS